MPVIAKPGVRKYVRIPLDLTLNEHTIMLNALDRYQSIWVRYVCYACNKMLNREAYDYPNAFFAKHYSCDLKDKDNVIARFQGEYVMRSAGYYVYETLFRKVKKRITPKDLPSLIQKFPITSGYNPETPSIMIIPSGRNMRLGPENKIKIPKLFTVEFDCQDESVYGRNVNRYFVTAWTTDYTRRASITAVLAQGGTHDD